MVLLEQHQQPPFAMRTESQDYSLYPEPPQGAFSSAPMDLGISPDAFGYPRPGAECFPTTMGFDGAIYAEAPYGMSPHLYHDDSEMRVPSSNLSTTSIPSAPSSAMGSPRSNHGQPAPVPEWAGPQGLGVSPGIVDQSEYFSAGTEYSAFPGHMDGFQTPFEFAQPKPGFVGELAHVPRAHQHGSVSSCVSRGSVSTVVPEPILDLEPKGSPVSMSPTMSPASSRKSSLVFVSPVTSSSSFSSPPPPAWSSPTCGAEAMSPTVQTSSARMLSSFFSQSSGHFVAPLDSYPSILHPDVQQPMRIPFEHTYPPPPKPAGYPGSPAMTSSPQLRNGSTSPFPTNNYHPYSPFPAPMDQRRPSTFSGYSGEQHYSDGESKEKQRCPHPDCGKTFKDLKAHMLTHQQERPEKCPIQTCDYHIKGFARKYDKNRHTLTHYKGTMVCGFCPGSGSAAEKSFNRADVFKRHLTAVHGVEQTPPNSRKKTAAGSNSSKKLTGYAPDATGKCSTCSQTFSNAQDFYEHLDDCVLRIVQQEDPAEAVNAQRLAEVENDKEVHATLEKNQLPTTTQTTSTAEDEEDDDMEDDDPADEDFKGHVKSSSPTKKTKGNPVNGVQKSRGMTHSRGGMPIVAKNKGRKSRQNYPSSWGFDKGQMTMKKRVMTVFDGPRRLAKDDMMLSTEHEVRVKLSDGKAYVTDLDVQTMKRAAGFHNATDEEKGPWISDDPTEDQKQMMAAAQ